MERNRKQDQKNGGPHNGPHQFTMKNWISCAPFERLLHMEIVEASEGRSILTMPFLVEFAQGGGLMHGGSLVSLADTAVVMAIKSLVPPQTHFATTSLQSTFLRPVRQGIVTARARVLTFEKRDIDGEATLYDETGQRVFFFTSHFKIAKDSGGVFQPGA